MSEDAKPKVDASANAEKRDKIVVAEDSPPNRKILCHLLEKLGYEVVSCENARIAWDELQKPEHANTVAIISDIMMPEMDGIQFLKTIRGNDKFKKLPFVLVTAVSDRNYILEAKNNDVQGYILKPVTFQRVTEKLKELFPNKKFPQLAS